MVSLSRVFSPATTTMTSLFKPSPGRRRGSDLESGKSENADSDSDTFYIPSKNASIERLQQWRVRPISLLQNLLMPFFSCSIAYRAFRLNEMIMLVYLQSEVDDVICFLIGLLFMFGPTMNGVYRRKLHWCSMPHGDSVTLWT